jgi:pimeloyl-ACP methyl ester carboxylesterase
MNLSPQRRVLTVVLAGIAAWLIGCRPVPTQVMAKPHDPTPIASEQTTVDGLSMHYLAAGSGEALLLIHGYAETSETWRAVIPALAQRYRVLAPDLPGIGESAIPADGLDITTAAVRLHALVASLGVSHARVVGHDIGMMVAYAYAATYRAEVDKLVLMESFLPGIGDWKDYYFSARRWHFLFNGPVAEQLVAGRERMYLDHFWNDFAADPARSVSSEQRDRYVAAYVRAGRMRAAWTYFATIPETASRFAELGKTKLSMPVLVMTGAKAGGTIPGSQVPLVADHVQSIVMPDTGHWLVQERPAETLAALTAFL